MIDLQVQLPVKDMAWLEKTTVANSQRLDALQSEYKRQRDEGVKVHLHWITTRPGSYYMTGISLNDGRYFKSDGMSPS